MVNPNNISRSKSKIISIILLKILLFYLFLSNLSFSSISKNSYAYKRFSLYFKFIGIRFKILYLGSCLYFYQLYLHTDILPEQSIFLITLYELYWWQSFPAWRVDYIFCFTSNYFVLTTTIILFSISLYNTTIVLTKQ